ncbi:MAG: YggS family pyridoxal phosphate-dependent enzyme [Leptospirillia bacterium]
MAIREDIREVSRASGRSDLPRLVGVTKTRSPEEVRALVFAGVDHLAENRWESWHERLLAFPETLWPSIFWHFIGPIQGRALKRFYRPLFCIDTLDSLSHGATLSRLAMETGTLQKVLVEVNVCRNPGRAGVLPENLFTTLETLASLPGLHLEGLMVMGPIPGDGKAPSTSEVFAEGNALFKESRRLIPSMGTLSMGMSEDYREAIRWGSTEVRIGRRLFEGMLR